MRVTRRHGERRGRNSILSEKLQMGADLTLQHVRQAEEVKKQNTLLREDTAATFATGRKPEIPVGVV